MLDCCSSNTDIVSNHKLQFYLKHYFRWDITIKGEYNQPNHTKTYQLVINQMQLVLKPVATNMDMDAIIGSSTSHLKCPHEVDKEHTLLLWPAPKHLLMNEVLISPLKLAPQSKKELPDFGKKVSLQYIL